MLYTIIAVLVVLWLLGMISGTTLGGFIRSSSSSLGEKWSEGGESNG